MSNKDDVIEKIVQYVVRARWIMDEYKILFLNNEGTLDLLNKCGSSFFKLVKIEFEEGITLKLAKLTDEYQSGSNKNLSIGYFLVLASRESWKSKEKLEEIYNMRIRPSRALIQTYRNKYLAHFDFNKNLGGAINQPEFEEVEKLLKAIEDFVRLAYGEIYRVHREFEILNRDGAGQCVHVMHNGYIYNNLCDDRDDSCLWEHEQNKYGHPAFKV